MFCEECERTKHSFTNVHHTLQCYTCKMASNVDREANEDRLRRRRERYKNRREREKPVKKDAPGLLNSAGITSLSLASLCHIMHILVVTRN